MYDDLGLVRGRRLSIGTYEQVAVLLNLWGPRVNG